MEFHSKSRGKIEYIVVSFGLLLSLSMLNGVKSDCVYGQILEPAHEYYLRNPNYPFKYQGNNECLWRTWSVSPTSVQCHINMPASNDCSRDYIEVKFAGETQGHKYCGVGQFSHKGMNATVTFYSPSDTEGGVFNCELITDILDPLDCSCGKKNEKQSTRIVGGSETGVNEYPMMAGLYDTTKGMIYCGATIITSKHVITAAHCVYEKNPAELLVAVGEHDVTTKNETSASLYYHVKSCTVHPKYDRNNNDIAVCEVNNRIRFNDAVSPVCLPFQHSCDSFGGSIVTALGWGLLDFGGAKAKTLQYANLNVISLEKCKKTYTEATNKNMCTYTEGKDTCQMDSGGPILWQDLTSHNLVLVGITTMGYGCATDTPALEERVGAYLDWIQSVTPNEQYCKTE